MNWVTEKIYETHTIHFVFMNRPDLPETPFLERIDYTSEIRERAPRIDFEHRTLLETICNVPPAEFEIMYYDEIDRLCKSA